MSVVWGQASRRSKKGRIMLEGPSGSGKTMSALLMATGLSDGKPIYLIDTERESASLYSHVCEFVTAQLTEPYSPKRYIEYINSVPADDCGVLIIDSISHEWNGAGGCISIHGAMPGNSFVNWGKVLPMHQAFVDTILKAPFHVICCCRSKVAYAQEESDGKKTIRKLGMEPQQRDGFDYEMDMVLSLDQQTHTAIATKNRTTLWADGTPVLITPHEGTELLRWLNTDLSDADTVFAYDLFAKASRLRDVNDLASLYNQNRQTIEASSKKKLIDAKFTELRNAMQATATRQSVGLMSNSMSVQAEKVSDNE